MRTREKVQVWVVARGWERALGRCVRVLVLRLNEKRGGFWQPVTGGMESGEKPLNAAMRELGEETGIVLKKQAMLRAVGNAFEFEKNGAVFTEHPFVVLLDLAENEPFPPAITLDPEEHVEFQWVEAEEAIGKVRYESNARVLRDAIRMLGPELL